MSAYVVFDIDIHDVDAYQAYRRLGAPTVAEYGGRFLVRGVEVETLEGEWSPKRVVVLEFESALRAREWYRSEGYQAAKLLREPAARTTGILAEGYVPVASDPR